MASAGAAMAGIVFRGHIRPIFVTFSAARDFILGRYGRYCNGNLGPRDRCGVRISLPGVFSSPWRVITSLNAPYPAVYSIFLLLNSAGIAGTCHIWGEFPNREYLKFGQKKSAETCMLERRCREVSRYMIGFL